MSNTTYYATGTDKTATARVFMSKGSGKITINNRKIEEYFGRIKHRMVAIQPLEVTELLQNFDFNVKVKGGGNSGQADAIRLAIARALVKGDETLRSALRKVGLLTRDGRRALRKLYGKLKARKSPQFSKR